MHHPKDIYALRAKLEWAEKHITDLEAFASSFSSTKNYPVKAKYDRKIKKYVFRLLNVPPIRLDIPLLAGDAIQHIASALDHAAYRLACVGTKSSGPFGSVYFPIGKSLENFKSRIKSMRELLRADAIGDLTEVEAYPGGRGQLLWQLHQLNNIDKHRLLLTVAAQNRFYSMPPEQVSYNRRRFLAMNDQPEKYDHRLFLVAAQVPLH